MTNKSLYKELRFSIFVFPRKLTKKKRWHHHRKIKLFFSDHFFAVFYLQCKLPKSKSPSISNQLRYPPNIRTRPGRIKKVKRIFLTQLSVHPCPQVSPGFHSLHCRFVKRIIAFPELKLTESGPSRCTSWSERRAGSEHGAPWRNKT